MFIQKNHQITTLIVCSFLSLLLMSCSTTKTNKSLVVDSSNEQFDDISNAIKNQKFDPNQNSSINDDLEQYIKNRTEQLDSAAQNTQKKIKNIPKSKKEIQDEINSLKLFSSDLYYLTTLVSANSDDTLKTEWLNDGQKLINTYIKSNLNKKDSLKDSEYRQASLETYYIIGLFLKETDQMAESEKAAKAMNKIKTEYGLTFEHPISIHDGSQTNLKRAISDLLNN